VCVCVCVCVCMCVCVCVCVCVCTYFVDAANFCDCLSFFLSCCTHLWRNLKMLHNSEKMKKSKQLKITVTLATDKYATFYEFNWISFKWISFYIVYFNITKQSWYDLNPHRIRINSVYHFFVFVCIQQLWINVCFIRVFL